MKFHLLRLSNTPIYQQLRIEEALLRADDRNWCILNDGSPPAIVMGISGKPELLISKEKVTQKPLPIIRRFSGGGTVAVDHNTCFFTLICNAAEISVPCFPKQVFEWNAKLYEKFLDKHQFRGLENDYVLGEKKFGGNAQYFIKNRWLHHSTLLWDYSDEHMEYLLHPPKEPGYRSKRPHSEFLCRLNSVLDSREQLFEGLLRALNPHGDIMELTHDSVAPLLQKPHRKGLVIIE